MYTIPRQRFGPDLESRVVTLRRQLPRTDLQTERLKRDDESRFAMVYLAAQTSPEIVAAVRDWSMDQSRYESGGPWWRTLLTVLRLPPAVAAPEPGWVAEALTRGYVAVLRDDSPDPLVAPTSLELLFDGPKDTGLSPALRRAVVWPRLVAAMAGLSTSALFVAMSSYHHTLIPGPFLVALAASRSNLPFPVAIEILLAALISDAFQAAAMRTGGRSSVVPALAGTVLAFMAMMQVGVLGGVSGAAAILDVAVRAVLPNPALQRVVRLWRYIFIGAAAGLGVYGMTMLLFLMMVYLGEERVLEHPVRLVPAAVSR